MSQKKGVPMLRNIANCRSILAAMIISGFMLHQMVRVNISIAVVDMVDKNSSHINFNWDEGQKNEIIGCFFVGYLLSTIPGGRLSEVFGTRKVLGIGMLLSSILTMLTPLACWYNFYWILVIRSSIGLALGIAYPSIPPLVMKWVPPNDISKYLAHTIASSLGSALYLPLCGYLITYLGWASVFYVTGATLLIWVLLWFYLVYDSPDQHPRINKEEKELLKGEIQLFEKKDVPWRAMLTSKPVLAIIVAYSLLLVDYNFILNHLPSYFNQVLQFDIKKNGLLSSLPYIANYSIATFSSYLSAKWCSNKTFSTITIRRIFTTASSGIPIISLIIGFFWGYNNLIAVAVFVVWLGSLGCCAAGFMSNSTDIAPSYSGTIFGVAICFGSCLTYLSTKLITFITKEKQDFHQWKYVFCFLMGTNFISLTMYYAFSSAHLQSWNPNPTQIETKRLNEAKELKTEDTSSM